MHIYIYIHNVLYYIVLHYVVDVLCGPEPQQGGCPQASSGGNHFSNTTCPTQVFFKSGERCGKLN